MATPIPANRASFTVQAVLAATRATTASRLRDACNAVTTDSRGDVAGKLFVALSGDRFDAHGFVLDVLARGAWGVLVERDVPGADPRRVFRVQSTLDGLGELARAHRQRWGGRVLTIGGSAGKTTTRSATVALLDAVRPGRIHGTVGNLNNLVGVPMTLLGLEANHEVAVVELGTNQRGEMAKLASICQADVAILTCIGLEHTLGLGDLDGVEAEERDLFTAMRGSAQIIGNSDDARVVGLLSDATASREGGVRIWSYGQSHDATHRIVDRRAIDLMRSQVRILRKLGSVTDEVLLTTRLLGLPGALASTAALAAKDALFGSEHDASVLKCALDQDVGQDSRLKVIERSDRALVIDDCYNANPVSMRSSIAVAKELAAARHARLNLVLGDMLELGDLSSQEHAALAGELDGAAQVVVVGQGMLALVPQAEKLGIRVTHYASSDDAAPHVRESTKSGDVLLIKGSRGIRLERVVAAVIGGKDAAP